MSRLTACGSSCPCAVEKTAWYRLSISISQLSSSTKSYLRETSSFLASQDISPVLWKSGAHYRVHKKPSLVLILTSRSNRLPPIVHISVTSALFSSYLRLGVPGSLFRFSHGNSACVTPLSHAYHMPRPFHHP